MRFNCGLSTYEKREIEARQLEDRAKELGEWHRWFAVFPIRVGQGDCRWWEWVERKLINPHVIEFRDHVIPAQLYSDGEQFRAISPTQPKSGEVG